MRFRGESWAFWANFYFSWENGEIFWGQTCCILFNTKNEEKSQKISTLISEEGNEASGKPVSESKQRKWGSTNWSVVTTRGRPSRTSGSSSRYTRTRTLAGQRVFIVNSYKKNIIRERFVTHIIPMLTIAFLFLLTLHFLEFIL